ncbi:hypothetical protein NUW54_g13943 [Trametes sanguinea]|uniref:Uncharacterized protein n=1 Tax=Trametes sanguinea TaxID=158606 RepID=A0ACC1MG23_9APHY|nr:hypothetical protein NUW54_g13943 [Trametes sanguinea]
MMIRTLTFASHFALGTDRTTPSFNFILTSSTPYATFIMNSGTLSTAFSFYGTSPDRSSDRPQSTDTGSFPSSSSAIRTSKLRDYSGARPAPPSHLIRLLHRPHDPALHESTSGPLVRQREVAASASRYDLGRLPSLQRRVAVMCILDHKIRHSSLDVDGAALAAASTTMFCTLARDAGISWIVAAVDSGGVMDHLIQRTFLHPRSSSRCTLSLSASMPIHSHGR